jgi:hypothetical protein
MHGKNDGVAGPRTGAGSKNAKCAARRLAKSRAQVASAPPGSALAMGVYIVAVHACTISILRLSGVELPEMHACEHAFLLACP